MHRRLLPVASACVALALAGGLAACSGGGNETVVEVEPSVAPSGTASSPSATGTSSPTTSGSAEPGSDGPPEVVEVVARELAVPWGIAFFPNGDAIVTERDSARVLRIDGKTRKVVEVGQVGEAAPQGEGGLMGVAIDPAFRENRFVYFYVSTASDNRIVRARLEDGELGPTSALLTGIPVGQIHDGGRLAFGPDGYLYASTGEIGEGERAQDRDDLAGKILRITTNGDPAPSNPFGTPVFSYGHRNVQGLAFADQQLWASEFGQNTFDELNRIDRGRNYGWPEVEGTGGQGRGFTDPQATWDTAEASPSGLAFADGALWMAALRGSRLWRIPVEGDRAGEPEGFFVGEYGRMRTVVTTPDGDLWVTTSNQDGRGNPADDDDRILLVRP
ncbi:PQQ-dependent sugar dehydrogenase [Nocardioides sp. SYSU D00038]|uniref:PQQ-dependent sugar dehydrogenase n=1 Tax=Nocardioides sp. SYSU D00038 TaxID=2812554 RepID=UPI0027DCF348|nr:PQQ-dependent sugar dehydrogenase [Nocardioides sp. SYSU D00038]